MWMITILETKCMLNHSASIIFLRIMASIPILYVVLLNKDQTMRTGPVNTILFPLWWPRHILLSKLYRELVLEFQHPINHRYFRMRCQRNILPVLFISTLLFSCWSRLFILWCTLQTLNLFDLCTLSKLWHSMWMSVKFWRHWTALLHTSTVVCGLKMWQHAWRSYRCVLQLLDKHHQLPESKSNSTNVWAAGIYSLRIFNKHHFLLGGRGNHIHTVCNFYLFWSLHIYFCSWAPACGWVVVVVGGGRQIYGVW